MTEDEIIRTNMLIHGHDTDIKILEISEKLIDLAVMLATNEDYEKTDYEATFVQPKLILKDSRIFLREKFVLHQVPYADEVMLKLKLHGKLIKGEKIKIFNYGNCKRDFTYIDDIVEGVIRVVKKAPEKKNGEDGLPIPPYKVYNIGNSSPENLLDFVNILQEELVRAGVLPKDYDFEAHKELVPMQAGDVPVTFADTTPLEKDFGFRPSTPLREGLRKFAEWYKEFYM